VVDGLKSPLPNALETDRRKRRIMTTKVSSKMGISFQLLWVVGGGGGGLGGGRYSTIQRGRKRKGKVFRINDFENEGEGDRGSTPNCN